MPNATVRANAQAMPIDRRLFLAAGTAATVFSVLHAAMAHAVPAPVSPAEAFDAGEYVAVWERCGNIVYWGIGSGGKEWFAIYLPHGATFPAGAALRRFDAVSDFNADCTRKLIAYLKARGQEPGLPLNVGDGR